MEASQPLSEAGCASPDSRLRVTMSHMKGETITVRLEESMIPILDEVAKRSGRSRSEVIRDALKRQLMRERLLQLRQRAMPYAERVGIYTDEDVLKIVSAERKPSS